MGLGRSWAAGSHHHTFAKRSPRTMSGAAPYPTPPRDINDHLSPYTQLLFFSPSRSGLHPNHGNSPGQRQRQTDQRQASLRAVPDDERPLCRRRRRRLGPELRAWYPGHRRGQAVQVRPLRPGVPLYNANATTSAARTCLRISISRKSFPRASTTTSYPSSAPSRRENPRFSTTSLAHSLASCPSRNAARPPREYG